MEVWVKYSNSVSESGILNNPNITLISETVFEMED